MTAIMTPPLTVFTQREDDAINRSESETTTAYSPGTLPAGSRPSVGDPMDSLIQQWVNLAVRHARVRDVDGALVADVVGLDGAWADGATSGDAVAALAEVLTEWVTLKLSDGDKDIPPMEGVQLVLDG